MSKRLTITCIAAAAVLMLIMYDSEAQDSAGYLSYEEPLDWIAIAGDSPYLMFPSPGLPGELIDTNFGPVYSDTIDQVPTWLDPEPHFALPPVSSWVVNPGIQSYAVGLWLIEGQTDVEIKFFGERGIIFKTEEYLFSTLCNAGTRFCGARTAARVTRFEIHSAGVVEVVGFGLGESDLSPPVWDCPQGMVRHRYGGVAIYWQADVPAKVTSVENNGCLVIDLDRPGEDYGYWAIKTGVFRP